MKSLYFLILFLISVGVNAQNIQGIVKDNNGNPIEFASIAVNQSENHTHSDANGRYNLTAVAVGDTLFISHMFFESDAIILDENRIKINIQSTLLPKNFALSEVIITPDQQALKTISSIDLATNPVNNAQELLRRVPGLIIGQHAGGGKAEQIFLRGFDVDHGTDISLSIDGLPVNMVSHAHGQGYADLHFIMPEIIEQIDYGKGPYDAHIGNFATAGYVSFKTKDSPENSFFTSEFGSFNTHRTAGLLNLISTQNESAYIASEFLNSDGPFESTQAFNRFNFFTKYTKRMENNDQLSIWASHFKSRWDASGQIPERAVASGMISRFGAIDDTEGGQTSRSNGVLQYSKYLNKNSYIKTNAYLSTSDFLLYSNFTFFLEDEVNGDQIKQREKRNLYGLNTEYNYQLSPSIYDLHFRIGSGIRYDDVNENELSNTVNRKQVTNYLALGNVDETNVFGYADATISVGKFQLNTGLRVDHFNFLYQNDLMALYDIRSDNKTIVSPKLNLHYTINKNTQLFAKFGKGFHSNDSRVVIDQTVRQILPAAYGVDFGGVFKPHRNLIINAALWYLQLEQEFVYVGDAGIVEPSGRTRRQGLDFGLRYQPASWLFMYSDLTLADPRSIDEAEGENFIPLAPTFTNTGGISVNIGTSITGGLRYRHIGDRPANEDNSIIAGGYTVLDFNLNYSYKKLILGVEINNLLNTEWNETQFATESRLRTESASVEEIHFTPGFPFFIKGKLTYMF